MTRNFALAGAARRVRALAERIPQAHRPDLAVSWAELLDAIEDMSDRAALAYIADWQEAQERRLCSRLTGAPHEGEAA